MTSNLKRIIVIISVIFIVAFFLLIASTFFLKESSKEVLNQINHQREEQRQQQQAEDAEEEYLTKKENIKSFLEKFVVIYNSYTWGSFSNIESQYSSMSEEMKNKEKEKVERIKKEIENKPQEYFSTKASLIDSEFLLYNENRVEIIMNLNIKSFGGAIVQRETIILVDAGGNHYMGNFEDLMISSNNKKIKINCSIIDNKCVVDKIENINNNL